MNGNRLTGFERLASLSNRERPPELDVADRVLLSLASRQVTRTDEREMVYFGTASLVAASIALTVLYSASADDSLLPLIQPFVTVVP